MSDPTERKLFSVKHLWAIGVVVVTGTATITLGWYRLDAKAEMALEGNKTLATDVRTMKCLIEKQNHYLFYKQIPEWACN